MRRKNPKLEVKLDRKEQGLLMGEIVDALRERYGYIEEGGERSDTVHIWDSEGDYLGSFRVSEKAVTVRSDDSGFRGAVDRATKDFMNNVLSPWYAGP